jgi:hypothetical protein
MSNVIHTGSRSPRRARRAAGALLVALAAVTLVWIGRASAQEEIAAATRSISTQIPKADAVQTDIAACNDQFGFVNMPEMLVSFKIAGSAPRAVIVLFAGEWFAFTGEPPTQARIRLSIDGIAQPEEVAVAKRLEEPIDDATHGFNFATSALAPGLHVARIQWEVSGGQFCIGDRSLIVMHK